MPIPFAIIGTSWITHSFISGAHATRKWELAAVYSRNHETAKEFAAKYNDPKISLYTSLNDLTSNPSISTIYIASPNILHYDHAKQMLLAGKNVVLEKPSCSTSAELDELFKIAKSKNVILIEAFRHLHESNFLVLKNSLEKVGTLYGASFTYAQYSSRYDKVLAGEVPNIFNLEMGGGALVDLGVYCISTCISLFGNPETATYWPVKIATGADGAGHLILTYPTFTVHLCHSKIYNSDAPSEIYGEKGTLIIPSVTDIEKVTFWDARGKNREELAGANGKEELNLKAEAEEFGRCIEEKDWERVGEYEKVSRDVLGVLEKVRHDNGLLFAGGK